VAGEDLMCCTVNTYACAYTVAPFLHALTRDMDVKRRVYETLQNGGSSWLGNFLTKQF